MRTMKTLVIAAIVTLSAGFALNAEAGFRHKVERNPGNQITAEAPRIWDSAQLAYDPPNAPTYGPIPERGHFMRVFRGVLKSMEHPNQQD